MKCFLIMGSPAQIRLYRFDDQKVNDLTNIQWQVVNFWQQKEKLPSSLAELKDPISNYTIPADPQPEQSYEYNMKGKLTFELCATFNAETQPSSTYESRSAPIAVSPAMTSEGKDLMVDSWQHSSGRVCFERTIDPQRYPPYSKQKNL